MICAIRELLINNRHVKRRDNVLVVKPTYMPESLMEQNSTVEQWNSYMTLVCCFEFCLCSDYALDVFCRLRNE